VRRNLLIILCHGLRSDAIGDGQAWPLRTPGLESLAERGLRVIAGAASPADPAAMVSLMTAEHYRQHGIADGASESRTIDGWAKWLRDADYHLEGVGQVGMIRPHLHTAIETAPVAIDKPQRCAYLDAVKAKGVDKAVAQQRRQRRRAGLFEPDRLLLEPEDDIDGFIATEARKRLEAMPTDRPWALVVVFSGPGNDLPPPTLYDGVVAPSVLQDGFIPADLKTLDDLAELDYPRILLQRMEPRQLGRIRADYLGRVGLIDHGIERLAGTLGQRGDRERSWTVIGSDRGILLGEHGLIGHRSFLAGAVETPGLVLPPKPIENLAYEGLVSTVDLAATIADLGGCDIPLGVAGRSLLPLLRGEDLEGPASQAVISEFGRRLMFETERYKVIFDIESREALGMYDMLHDAEERTNLVKTVKGRNLLDALRWRLGDVLLPIRAVAP